MPNETQREWLPHDRLTEVDGPVGRLWDFDLRPLSLGEVLDRTFALFRAQFWLFCAIAAVAALVRVLVQAASLTAIQVLMGALPRAGTAKAPFAVPRGFWAAQLTVWVANLAFFLVSAIVQAAMTSALSDVYLRRAVTAGAVLRDAFRHWGRWIGIAFWQLGSLLWVPAVVALPAAGLLAVGARTGNTVLAGLGGVLLFAAILAGFPVGLILYLRNGLAVPAAVVEHLHVRPAMRRSKQLAAGTKGRLFVVLLIVGCLYLVVGVLQSPVTLLLMFAPKSGHILAEGIGLLISFVGYSLVAPVAAIGITLVYLDQRVRREALDLQVLLSPGQWAPGQPPAAQAIGSQPLA